MSTVQVCAAVDVCNHLGYMPENGIRHLFFIKKCDHSFIAIICHLFPCVELFLISVDTVTVHRK